MPAGQATRMAQIIIRLAHSVKPISRAAAIMGSKQTH
jgi:hypothetical protein